MSDTPKLNLRQKLIQVYSDVDHVEKAGRNSKQNYNFVRAADVLRAIRASFAALGIYAETNYELLGTYDIKTNSGGTMHTATVKATIKLYDADSDETKTISGLGDGADSGDKGIFKAQTGATKNALRNGTLLPDEADSEADEVVDTSTSVTYPQAVPEEPPDFQNARHAAPRKNTPKADTDRPTQAPADSATNVAGSPATVSAPPERGDAYEGPEDGVLPTEEELAAYRANFKTLCDDLSTEGKLKTSRSLPINRKVLVFMLQVTQASDAKTLTTRQWDNFFERVTKARALEAGLVGLGKLINKANGIEEKEK